jgi:hypothetical protein
LEKEIKSNLDNPIYVNVKDTLDNVGCGMCLAKWTQVTLLLQCGHNHSCHHPSSHKISEEEIKRNPSALHNTRYKKLRRREMLNNERPVECDYCWITEDTSDRFSDRIFKSAESWSWPFRDEIFLSNWRENYNPKYVEVSFSNICNFKCSYCGPAFSTKWMEEVKQYGGYETYNHIFNDLSTLEYEKKIPIPINDYNPYVEAFWKWWPDLYKDLHTFRITGGEPLLDKNTWDILDYIIDNPNPNKELKFAINSNLGVTDKLIDKLIEKINKIEDEYRVKEFIIFTSVDSWGKQAEYIRYGMNFNKFWDNINKILEKCPRVIITIMSTYNALSVPQYNKLITEIYSLKDYYGAGDRYWNSAIFLDTSYLRYPNHQTVRILTKDFNKNVFNQTKLMYYYATPSFDNKEIGYSDIEVQKVKRIYDWMESPQKELELKNNRIGFSRFIQEYDRRRGLNFVETFPELEDFFELCKKTK